MHPDLAAHLHTEECNKLIKALLECHKENSFGKFVGKCNNLSAQMLACMKRERQARRDANLLQARKDQAERRDRIRNDPNDYTEIFKRQTKS